MKTIIITGAASGIGAALAREYAKQPVNLVLADVNFEPLQVVVEELHHLNVLCVKTDLTKEEDCKNLIEKTVEKFGNIHVLINNAGISMRAMFGETQLSVLHELMNVNFWGAVYCTKFALPYLLQSKGSVVGVISIAGHIGLPGRTAYSASKFALRGFLDTLRSEYQRKGLHVFVVAPSFVSSNIRKTARLDDGSLQRNTPINEDKAIPAKKKKKKIIKGIEKRKRSQIIGFSQGRLPVLLSKIMPQFVDNNCYKLMAKEQNTPVK
jgi:short-subunit dehydrogenase